MQHTGLGRTFSVLFAAVVAASVARAQDMYPSFAPDNMNTIMSSHIAGLSLKNVVRHNATKGSKTETRRGSRSASGSTVTPRTTTSYVPSARIAAQVRDQSLAKIRAVSPAEADKTAVLLHKNDAATLWKNQTAAYGLQRNDLADAMTAHWIINYLLVNGLGEASPAAAQGARNQIHRLLETTPVLTRLSDSDKQTMTEKLYLSFLYQHAALEQANKPGNAAQKAQLSTTARAQFQKDMGIDLRTFTLTSAGFRQRS